MKEFIKKYYRQILAFIVANLGDFEKIVAFVERHITFFLIASIIALGLLIWLQ